MTDILGRLTSFHFAEQPEILNRFRELTTEEIDFLTASGCYSSNWKKVLIAKGTDLSLIRRCSFYGTVYIDLPSGELSDSSIEDCVINGPLTVKSTDLISGYSLNQGSLTEFCGSIVWNGDSFLRGSIHGGVETGERDMPLIPVMDHMDAAYLASAQGRKDSRRAEAILLQKASDAKGVIGEGAVLRNCPLINDSVFMKGSSCENAGSVKGSLLMEEASASHGAIVLNSVIQWNGRATTQAVVDSSILGEYSTAEKQGRLTCSFLGADSVLGGGEITASVAGPLTGMHHQSLLIAACWPEGRGNIGYGANVGSNHTSRVPDQEIKPGTGLFFGLGCSVKFPADYSESPWSVIATGVTTMPQKVSYPFSLILSGENAPEGTPPGWSRLIPGWMLRANLYSVLRNLWKHQKRARAVHTKVETQVFTDEVLALVRRSAEQLQNTPVSGAGCCFILEKDRLAGIETYDQCLRFFHLAGKKTAGKLTGAEAEELLNLVNKIIDSVVSSRTRDMERGSKIISDYAEVRCSIVDDPFITAMKASADRFAAELKKFTV